jgi:amino acid adenylation domain-containing protein
MSLDQRAIQAMCARRAGSVVEFTDDDVERPIPERFEAIARRFPDLPAVNMSGHGVTYGELNAMGNRFARAIAAKRGDDGGPVALLFDRGIDYVAAVLGTLKAGAPLVLLDPSFPVARLMATLADAEAALIVTDAQHASLGREVAGHVHQLLDGDSIRSEPLSANVARPIAPDALAYISFTSGSTGKPKGVMQTHRAAVHDVMRRANITPLGAGDRMSLFTHATPNSLKGTLFTLLQGATLLPLDVRIEGLAHLAGWLRREHVTVVWIGSAGFRDFAEALTPVDTFPDVRLLRLTSDAVHMADVDLFRAHFPPDCVLVTGLHASETGATRMFLMTHATEIPGQEVPLGYPMEGQDIVLVDDEGEQVGANEVGEIVVRSKYLSPGYWRRPDLTAAKFRRDPRDPQAVFYHTGDLGLLRPDGCLIHRGRKDLRVKVRGHGVDIVEVEAALRAHPSISRAVVTARPNDAAMPLVAYFTSPAESAPTAGGLRRHLRQTLPEHAVPSRFIRLETMPLTSSGKVDRRSLPDPGTSRPALDTPLVPPGNSIEAQLAGIWADVLVLDRIGIHDDFFELGGHSLTAARVVARVTDTFRVVLSMRALFESPTVAAMATIIAGRRRATPAEDDVLRVLDELDAMSDAEATRVLAREIGEDRRDG